MKKSNFGKAMFAVLLVLMLALSACGSDKSSEDKKDKGSDEKAEQNDGKFSIEDFPTRGEQGEAEEGGTLNFGLVSDTAFEGTLNFAFYAGATDAEVIEWFDESLLSADENFQFTQDRSEEHTSELQSRGHLVCRLLLEKKN